MISAIVLTWNSEKYIGKCLQALFKSTQKTGENLEIIVVDNGSKDSTLKEIEKIRQSISDLILVELEKNRGTTYSRNLAVKKSKGEHLLFLDSDVELEENTIPLLLQEIKNKPEVGMVCPTLMYPDGTIQQSIKRFITLKTKIFKFLGLRLTYFKNLAERDEFYGKDTIYPDYSISACWLVQREVFNKIGGFDERIFYAPEDADFCVRVWLAGFKVMYVKDATALHHTQRISYKNKKIALHHILGLFYYFFKYDSWFSRERVYRKIEKAIARSYPVVSD